MSVPEDRRGERKMEVFTKACELTVYTIKICTNQNIFLPEYQNALTNDIIATAKDIFMLARGANDIRVTNVQSRSERLKLQWQAIRKCNDLLALMLLAQRLFHLKTKRIKFWSANTKEVRTLLQKWHDADVKRYKDIGM